MKRLKRFCWLAAWCVWLWLGVGLFRELPRKVGPPVCRIPVASYQAHSTHIAGFDGPNRVVVAELPEHGPNSVAVYDAESGERVASYPGPKVEWRFSRQDCRLHHGHFIVNERENGGLRALDLSDGVYYTINPTGVGGFAIHPTEPLVAFKSSTDASGRRLAVYDLKKHRLAFKTDLVLGGELDTPMFIPGTDKLLLMRSVRGSFEPAAGTRLVLCTITPSGVLTNAELFNIGRANCGWATTSHTGRAVFGFADGPSFEVFDFEQNRIVFSRRITATEANLIPAKATQNPPAISANGRTVLGDWPQTLWEIDTGKPLWRAREIDFAFPDLDRAAAPSVGTRFVHLERWSELWKRWLPGLNYTTLACRDMRDGSLLYRVKSDGGGDGSYNVDWSLVIGDDGLVYRLPPPVNWQLLALCQTVLALPLVLLWAVFRWRARKKARSTALVRSSRVG